MENDMTLRKKQGELLELRFNERDTKLYTSGDTIRAEVVLNISEPQYSFSRIGFQISCNEVLLHGTLDRFARHYRKILRIPEPSCSSPTILPHGRHLYPVEIFLDEETVGLPPSVSCDFLCAKGNFIEWVLSAWVEVDYEHDCTEIEHFTRDRTLRVYPKAAPHEAKLLEKTVSCEQFCLQLSRLPNLLPQTPEKFDLQIFLLPHDSLTIRGASVSFETELVSKFGHTKRKQLLEKELLGHVTYKALLEGGTSFPICFTDCHLGRRTPSAFRTKFRQMSHKLLIEVESDEKYAFHIPIDVESPTLLRAARSLKENEADPPAYNSSTQSSFLDK